MSGRRKTTIAAVFTATLALAAMPVWTDAKRQQARGGDGHKTARNVIVLQGDGMATAQRDLIRLVAGATSRATSSS